MITIVVAIDKNNGIGKDNKLLCYLPNDLKHFKEITTGGTVIMGRKTYDSLPNGALPKRRNIVISRQKDLQLANCEVFNSLSEAFADCSSDESVFIMGGENVYSQTIANADRLEITEIDARFDADAFFPKIDEAIWEVEKEEKHLADEIHKYNFTFITYKRR